jgi:thiosulfate/3-mercaptopyruvate sulfurtransferase
LQCSLVKPQTFATFILKISKMSFKKTVQITFVLILSGLFTWQETSAQSPVTWTNDQLLQPSELATVLKDNKEIPVIFSIGPGAVIPHSKDIGMIKEEENMKKFKQELENLSKDTSIIIYCGCCPYEHCPNVRPAIQLLKEMKFTNYKLLDLPHNIKIDWINKGYPTGQ